MSGYERVFVTSDTHGMARFDALRAWAKAASPSDLLLHAGDSEILDPFHKGEPMRFFASLSCHVALIDGNHDDYPRMLAQPGAAWCGGPAHRLAANIWALERGEIYAPGDWTLFAFGGAMMEGYAPSPGELPGELPTATQLERAANNLRARSGRVDMILTHDGPESIVGARAHDPVRPFLQCVYEASSFNQWIYGHHHQNQITAPRLRCVCGEVVRLL